MKKVIITFCLIFIIFLTGCDTTTTTTVDPLSPKVCETYSVPEFEYTLVHKTKSSVTFDIKEVLVGCDSKINQISLKKGWGGSTVDTITDIQGSEFEFTGLVPATLYYINIETTYDMPEVNDFRYVLLRNFYTLPDMTLDLIDIDSTSNTISFEVLLEDINNLISISSMWISTLDGYNMTLEPNSSNLYLVQNLEPSTEYIVHISYSFYIDNAGLSEHVNHTSTWVISTK